MTVRVAMRLLAGILPLALLAFVLPATATARHRITVEPPGDSGISQYAEVVPTGAGASPPSSSSGAGAGGGGGGALTAIQRRALNALGPDGRTLVAVVDATSPQSLGIPTRPATRVAPSTGRGADAQAAGFASPAVSPPLPSSSGGSAASLVFDAVAGHGGGGLGIFLPGFMLVSALGVAALVVRRRRASL